MITVLLSFRQQAFGIFSDSIAVPTTLRVKDCILQPRQVAWPPWQSARMQLKNRLFPTPCLRARCCGSPTSAFRDAIDAYRKGRVRRGHNLAIIMLLEMAMEAEEGLWPRSRPPMNVSNCPSVPDPGSRSSKAWTAGSSPVPSATRIRLGKTGPARDPVRHIAASRLGKTLYLKCESIITSRGHLARDGFRFGVGFAAALIVVPMAILLTIFILCGIAGGLAARPPMILSACIADFAAGKWPRVGLFTSNAGYVGAHSQMPLLRIRRCRSLQLRGSQFHLRAMRGGGRYHFHLDPHRACFALADLPHCISCGRACPPARVMPWLPGGPLLGSVRAKAYEAHGSQSSPRTRLRSSRPSSSLAFCSPVAAAFSQAGIELR